MMDPIPAWAITSSAGGEVTRKLIVGEKNGRCSNELRTQLAWPDLCQDVATTGATRPDIDSAYQTIEWKLRPDRNEYHNTAPA